MRAVGSRWQRRSLLTKTLKAQILGDPAYACADAVPGVFTFLGIRNETIGSVHGLHTPRFTMDEAQLPLGAALHASMAFAGLRWAADGAAATPSAQGAGHEEL